MYPPSVLEVISVTPCFPSESGMTLIISKEVSEVSATYPRGTVSSMATATMGTACLVENFPAQPKYLLESMTRRP